MWEKIHNDIQSRYYHDYYSNDGQRFVAWYLINIHGLDKGNAKKCITDEPNDKQIDAVYIDENQMSIYIIQGKFYKPRYSVRGTDFEKVNSSWVHIVNKNFEKLQEDANENLKGKINEIRDALDKEYKVHFEFITTANIADSAEPYINNFEKLILDNRFVEASLEIVDSEILQVKYNDALGIDNARVDFDFEIDINKCMKMELNGIKTILAAVPLGECVDIKGIKDGRLFSKNVRQFLGKDNEVNKGIEKTIRYSNGDFFFYHNGITAVCSEIKLTKIKDKDKKLKLSVKDMNVVNGCQSLNTIYRRGQTAKNRILDYILFKFYEIKETDEKTALKIDNITNNTNSQSKVNAIDMRSNDKIVKGMKRAYEKMYNHGYFQTQTGKTIESKNPLVDKNHVVELSTLAKQLMAWHGQRPNISYSETTIFSDYFNQLFHKNYKPEDMQALKDMFDAIMKLWANSNPEGINEELFKKKANVPYHFLYAISALVNVINNKTEKVPSPSKVYERIKKADIIDNVLDFTVKVLNNAFITAKSSSKGAFVTLNWIKTKSSVDAINDAVKNQLLAFKVMPAGRDFINKLSSCLKLTDSDYTARYSAD